MGCFSSKPANTDGLQTLPRDLHIFGPIAPKDQVIRLNAALGIGWSYTWDYEILECKSGVSYFKVSADPNTADPKLADPNFKPTKWTHSSFSNPVTVVDKSGKPHLTVKTESQIPTIYQDGEKKATVTAHQDMSGSTWAVTLADGKTFNIKSKMVQQVNKVQEGKMQKVLTWFLVEDKTLKPFARRVIDHNFPRTAVTDSMDDFIEIKAGTDVGFIVGLFIAIAIPRGGNDEHSGGDDEYDEYKTSLCNGPRKSIDLPF